jgi:hypothetical protein
MSAEKHMPNGQRLLIAICAIAWTFISLSLLLEHIEDGQLRALLDQPWPRAACGITSIAAIFLAGPAIIVSVYYFLSMLPNVRPEERSLVPFIAPLSIFLPQLWTEPGNRYRKLFLLWIAIFAFLSFIPLTCKSLVL